MKYLCKGCAQELHYYSRDSAMQGQGSCYECDRSINGKDAYLYSEKLLAECDVCGCSQLFPREKIGDKVSCKKCGAWGYLDESGEIIGSGSL